LCAFFFLLHKKLYGTEAQEIRKIKNKSVDKSNKLLYTLSTTGSANVKYTHNMGFGRLHYG